MQNNEESLRIMQILNLFFRPAKRLCRVCRERDKIFWNSGGAHNVLYRSQNVCMMGDIVTKGLADQRNKSSELFTTGLTNRSHDYERQHNH
jgi:hypothetical protein